MYVSSFLEHALARAQTHTHIYAQTSILNILMFSFGIIETDTYVSEKERGERERERDLTGQTLPLTG